IPASLPARGHYRSDGRPRRGPPGPAGRAGDDHGRVIAGASRGDGGVSEPEKRGVAWTAERGTSDEGRRRSEGGMGRRVGPRRRTGSTVIGPELRYLPWSQVHWERNADVVVVGSGAAGMTAALTAAGHGRRVLLLSKEDIGGGATPLAQGGLAAAIGPADNPALHQRDTLDAGAGLCDPAAVATLVSEAPGEIARLARRGARL